MENEQREATSMFLRKPTKERFDTVKRKVEAHQDEDLTNSDVLDLMIESFDVGGDR